MKIVNEKRLVWVAERISKLCKESKEEAELAVLREIAEGFVRAVAGATMTSELRVGAPLIPIQISIHKRHALREEEVKPYVLMVAKHFQTAADAEKDFAEELYKILSALRDALGFEIIWEESGDETQGFNAAVYIDFEEQE